MKQIVIFLQVLCLVYGQSVQVDCPLPDGPSSSSQAQCDKYSACIWENSRCLMRSDVGYVATSAPVDTGRGFQINLQIPDPSVTLFDADIINAVFEVIYHEDYHVQVKIYDPANSRYEVPFPLNLPATAGTSPLYSVTTSNVGDPFGFSITRASNGNSIYNSYGPITFEDQFIQISTTLDNTFMYGFGENSHTTFRHQFSNPLTYPMFARDQPNSPSDFNQYGVQPYYVNIEDDQGNTHSVFLYSSNAMEYTTSVIDAGQALLTLKTIGGIIDLHFFLGPNPEDVNLQFAAAIGKAAFPPYWALGFHLSRYGYNTLDNLKAIRARMKAAGIPQDVQTCDIDYMDRCRDFTYDPVNWAGFPQYIDELHADGVKLTLILDPAVVIDPAGYPTYNRGKAQDAYIKWMSSNLVPTDQLPEAADYMIGYVWPDSKTVFPDFLKPETQTWWSGECQIFHDTLSFDALWIDMNEPANFGTNLNRPFNYPPDLPDWSLKCPYTSYDSPPFPTKATYQGYNDCKRISDKTICMSAAQTDGANSFIHYDVHNLFGLTESIATYKALDDIFPGKRHLVLSRSTFPGSGQYVAHWLGDNTANWEQLKMSIIGLMEFNLFVIPNVGADICGFFDDTTEELCSRWMELGAFYPFSRNHNTLGAMDQDPANPALGRLADISRNVLLLRYQYLPFLYSLFHRASMDGNSIVRPLFNVFPTDVPARDVDDQFMWGSMLMVAPVVYQGAVSRNVYFPESYWYDLVDGTLVPINGIQNVAAPLEKIPVYVRGGSILPYQEPDVTTTLSRLNPFGLTVALDDAGSASGEVFWDDGDGVHVMAETYMSTVVFSSNNLSMTVKHGDTVVAGLNIETIQFYGYGSNPSNIDANGTPLDPSAWTFDAASNVLIVTLSLPLGTDFLLALS